MIDDTVISVLLSGEENLLNAGSNRFLLPTTAWDSHIAPTGIDIGFSSEMFSSSGEEADARRHASLEALNWDVREYLVTCSRGALQLNQNIMNYVSQLFTEEHE